MTHRVVGFALRVALWPTRWHLDRAPRGDECHCQPAEPRCDFASPDAYSVNFTNPDRSERQRGVDMDIPEQSDRWSGDYPGSRK